MRGRLYAESRLQEIAMNKRIRAEVLDWVEASGDVLRTCQHLTGYFGTEREWSSLEDSLRAPSWWRDAIERLAKDGIEPIASEAPVGEYFQCGRPLAARLSPCFQLLAEPIPDFVNSARRTLSGEQQRVLILPFAHFSGYFSRYVCKKIWERYPDLAPKDWPLNKPDV